jgi:cyclopropane fatty-acyl-phospholipid synthase-like methyltransferase
METSGVERAGGVGRDEGVVAEQVERLGRVYGPVTWDVYAELDRSLGPRGPEWLVERAAGWLVPGATVLDAGCRDGAQLVRLVGERDVTGYGIDPVELHVRQAREAVAAAGLGERIRVERLGMEELAGSERRFDLIWCREVVPQLADLGGALVGAASVLKGDGRMVVFTQTATELLTSDEAEMMSRHLGNVMVNLEETTLEAAFADAGLVIEEKDVIGTEWREYAEERTQPVSRALLRLARLRRTREAVVAAHGEDVYQHVEANLHWEVYQFLGKLRATVYVLKLGDGF